MDRNVADGSGPGGLVLIGTRTAGGGDGATPARNVSRRSRRRRRNDFVGPIRIQCGLDKS